MWPSQSEMASIPVYVHDVQPNLFTHHISLMAESINQMIALKWGEKMILNGIPHTNLTLVLYTNIGILSEPLVDEPLLHLQ